MTAKLEYIREISDIKYELNTNNIIRPKIKIKPKPKTKEAIGLNCKIFSKT